ncbi:MAG: hypothetical protein AMJ79_05545 [Phycisphaerae bacterium SM23_30]|nr:MAG: hypothetical protein AMJ79_05545 [Phycisphaerae bacterium SM23_30]
MYLYLVRHGIAKSKQEDPEQHLTKTGLQEVRKVAEFIKSADLHVGSIWHSGKARAAQTAKVFSSVMEIEKGLIQRDGLAPNDPIKPVQKEIDRFPKNLMIVGHLPFLSKLASKLLTDDESTEVISFPNSGVVCLECVSAGAWKLAWMINPQLLA